LIDVTRNTNLTEERLGILTAIKFDQLPLDLAFQMVRGNGKRKMAYFTDPNCPYCKHLEQELAKLTDVTIYLFLYPILSQNSQDKSRAVWCSKDRVKTWNDMMLNDIAPPATGACNTPIEKILAFGRQKNIRGTPTLFFANGQRVSGAISSDQLNKLLDSAR
jgi:thiol:disulfide interchange protein DsbC